MSNQDKWPVEIPDEEKPLETAPTVPVADIRRKFALFAAGFLGWFLISGAIWFLFLGREAEFPVSVCMIPANIIVMILLGRDQSTRPVSLGILTALSVNFLISSVRSLLINTWCLIPFFITT